MKPFYQLLLLLWSSSLWGLAPNLNEQILEIDQIYQQGEYQQVLTITEEILKTLDLQQVADTSLVQLCTKAAEAALNNSEFERAQKYLNKTIPISKTFKEKAIPLMEQVTAIDAQTLGTTHPYYAYGLNNLALSYQKVHDFEKAEALYTNK